MKTALLVLAVVLLVHFAPMLALVALPCSVIAWLAIKHDVSKFRAANPELTKLDPSLTDAQRFAIGIAHGRSL
jgi:hypothetical protein